MFAVRMTVGYGVDQSTVHDIVRGKTWPFTGTIGSVSGVAPPCSA